MEEVAQNSLRSPLPPYRSMTPYLVLNHDAAALAAVELDVRPLLDGDAIDLRSVTRCKQIRVPQAHNQ